MCVIYKCMSFWMKRLLNSGSFIVVKVIRVSPWSESKSYRVIGTLAIYCRCAINNILTIHCDCAHIIIHPIMVWSLACLQMVAYRYTTQQHHFLSWSYVANVDNNSSDCIAHVNIGIVFLCIRNSQRCLDKQSVKIWLAVNCKLIGWH